MQSDSEFAPTQIAAAEFPTAFRGYDQDAVRHYLTRLASALEENGGDALAALARTTTLDRIEELEEENDALRSEVRDLELELVQRSVDGVGSPKGRRGSGQEGEAVDVDIEALGFEAEVDSAFDEHRAIELLGKETARVLESARSAASDIVKKAERQAKTVEKDARAQLGEARRKARRLVAEKQSEAEELVAKVASEAEEAAQRLRADADKHREMVLAESKKIMADAESQAEADERWAQERAEQIVADAEALRQQLLSELVVERTKVRTDVEEMSTARDRLVMSLVVARSELDEMSQRLDAISVRPGEHADPEAVDDGAVQAEVDELVSRLDGDGDDSSPRSGSKRRKSARGSDEPTDQDEAADQDDEVIDLTDGDGGGGEDSPAPSDPDGEANQSDGKPSSSGRRSSSRSSGSTRKSSSTKSKAKKSNRRRGSRSGPQSKTKTSATAASTATAVVDPEDDELLGEAEAGNDVPTEQSNQDPTEVVEADASEDEDGTETVDESSELSLIEGFNTIELTEADLGLARTSSDSQDTGEVLDQVITTVASREQGVDTDGNRGDLLVDEDYRGRLPAAIAARDSALAKADDFHRSLRRTLNDDQSDVLDRLRAGRGSIEVSELPRVAEQLERYIKPLRDGLAPVALAGARAGGRREISAGVLDNLVEQLAKYIVDKVRIPVIREVEHATDHDREKLFEPIRTVYRDFRNTALLDLADDALYESFAIGVYSAIDRENPVVWLLDPRHDPDPVCEINASKSGVTKGQKFPSGHVRPLALPNCRCLVVPD